MGLEKINKELQEVKKDLISKFKKKGLDDNEIQVNMDSVDTEFLIHVFVNGKFLTESDTEERLGFYKRFLELKAKEIK